MASIAGALARIKDDLQDYLPDQQVLGACRDARHVWRERKLGPVATLHLFVLQVLHCNTAIRGLRHLIRQPLNAAAYCRARMRLPLSALMALLRRSAGEIKGVGSLRFSRHPTKDSRPRLFFTISSWMDMVAKGTSQTADGAGFRTYYVLDDLATAHHASFATKANAKTYIDGEKTFASFTHLHLIDELGAWGTGGQAWSDRQTVVGIDWLSSRHPGFWTVPAPALAPTFDGFVASYTSHELHHTYAWNSGDDFAVGGHLNDTNGNGTQNEVSDYGYVMYNYNHLPKGSYNWQDYAQVKYGYGTTQHITIR